MPTPAEILRGLSLIANQFLPLAVLWHVLVFATLVAIARGLRPSRRTACLWLSAPLASVSALAWGVGNAFNGLVFALLVVALLVIASRLSHEERVRRASAWTLTIGSLALVYAWLYPHFLESYHPAVYLIAAPLGLLPCPSLSVVLGFGLLVRGLDDRAFAFTTGGVGLFYGVFGMLRLGVWLDLGLVVAAIAMLVLAWRQRRGVVGLMREAPATTEKGRSFRLGLQRAA